MADVGALVDGKVPSGLTFVNQAPMTVDALLATFPAGAAYRGQYARTSDYGGYVDRVLRCDFDSGLNLYFWNPTQAEYGRTLPVTGDITLFALKSPPSVNLTGSIGVGVTRTVTIDVANRRPGEIIEIRNSLASLLGTLNVAGIGLGSVLSLALGGYSRFMMDGSSGTLQLTRLQ